MNTRALGSRAERRARRYYLLRGYRILATNARAGRNELDLVVRRGRHLIFVEVKQKSGDWFGEPAEMVDEEKQRRLRRAASVWLAAHPELRALDVSFDVFAVGRRRIERLEIVF